MKTASLVMGFLSIIAMFIGFIPCFGALNWVNIPFSIVGFIISIVAYTRVDGEPKGNAKAGIIMCTVAILFGMVRLFFGGGMI